MARATLGFINTFIYPLGLSAGDGGAFHDITSGSNGYPAVPGDNLATWLGQHAWLRPDRRTTGHGGGLRPRGLLGKCLARHDYDFPGELREHAGYDDRTEPL